MPDRAHGSPWFWRGLAVVGALGLAAILVAILVVPSPAAALRGWLAATALMGATMAATLAILALVRLVPGAWAQAFEQPLAGLARLAPGGLLLALPVLFGSAIIFPAPGEGGWWTGPLVTIGRSVVLLLALGALGPLLARRPSAAMACVVVIVVPLAVTALADDALLARDPGVRSSGFGLYVLSLGTCCAVSAGILAAPLEHRSAREVTAAGGILLTAVLLSSYFAVMPFMIVWSGNLPEQVTWYAERAAGWSALLWAWTLAQGLATALLMSPTVLRSPRWLARAAVIVLAAKAAECVWLVLPAGGRGPAPSDLAYAAAALLAAGALAAGAMGVMLERSPAGVGR